MSIHQLQQQSKKPEELEIDRLSKELLNAARQFGMMKNENTNLSKFACRRDQVFTAAAKFVLAKQAHETIKKFQSDAWFA